MFTMKDFVTLLANRWLTLGFQNERFCAVNVLITQRISITRVAHLNPFIMAYGINRAAFSEYSCNNNV